MESQQKISQGTRYTYCSPKCSTLCARCSTHRLGNNIINYTDIDY